MADAQADAIAGGVLGSIEGEGTGTEDTFKNEHNITPDPEKSAISHPAPAEDTNPNVDEEIPEDTIPESEDTKDDDEPFEVGDDDEIGSEKEMVSKKTFLKRIGKSTAQKRALEEKVADLEAQLEEKKNPFVADEELSGEETLLPDEKKYLDTELQKVRNEFQEKFNGMSFSAFKKEKSLTDEENAQMLKTGKRIRDKGITHEDIYKLSVTSSKQNKEVQRLNTLLGIKEKTAKDKRKSTGIAPAGVSVDSITSPKTDKDAFNKAWKEHGGKAD